METKNQPKRPFTVCSYMLSLQSQALPRNQKTVSRTRQFERKVKIAGAIFLCLQFVQVSFLNVYNLSLLSLLFSHKFPPLFTVTTP